MKYITLLILCLSFCIVCNGQNFSSQNPDYIFNAQAGERCLLGAKYDSCIVYYKRAFEIQQTSFLSTLRAAACAYSSDNLQYYRQQLKMAMEINWDGSKNIFLNYPEFFYLHGTSYAEDLMQLWESSARASGINIELMQELEIIAEKDQRERQQMGEIEEKYGWGSEQMDSLWKIQTQSDHENLARIEAIINEYGYPGKSIVGPAQSGTAFLVIQHADLEYQEKYLDLIIEAANKDEVSWRSVALLVDRVNMRKGLPQKYGSQIGRDEKTGEFYFAEIENPERIDSVRATVGLGPIQEYADNWNIQWDVEAHKKRVEAMKKQKEAQGK